MSAKLIRTLVLLIPLTLSAVRAGAQTNNFRAADQFQSSLKNLMESAQKLENGNDRLREENLRLRNSSQDYSGQLNNAEDKFRQISAEIQKIEERKTERAKNLKLLNKEIAGIDAELKEVEEARQSRESRLQELFQEELLISVNPPVEHSAAEPQRPTPDQPIAPVVASAPEPQPPPSDDFRQQRLQLMKLILESQKRQQQKQKQIISHVPKNSISSLRLAQLESQKQLYLGNKVRLQREIDALSIVTQKAAPAQPIEEIVTDDQMEKINGELKDLTKKYNDLLTQMKTNADSAKKTAKNDVQTREAHQLEESIATLKKENKTLRGKIKELRGQMVDLDKKKLKTELRMRGI